VKNSPIPLLSGIGAAIGLHYAPQVITKPHDLRRSALTNGRRRCLRRGMLVGPASLPIGAGYGPGLTPPLTWSRTAWKTRCPLCSGRRWSSVRLPCVMAIGIVMKPLVSRFSPAASAFSSPAQRMGRGAKKKVLRSTFLWSLGLQADPALKNCFPARFV